MIERLFISFVVYMTSISNVFCEIYPELEHVGKKDMDSVYEGVEVEKSKEFLKTYRNVLTGKQKKNLNYLDETKLQNAKDIDEAYLLNKRFEDLSNSIYSFGIYNSSLFSPVENSLFETIFKSNNSSAYGPVYIEYDSSFGNQKKVNGLGYHFGFGFGYFQGLARAVNTNIETKTKLTLWFVPVDLGISYRVSLSSAFGVKVSAGLTASGMIQSRSDFRDNESGKNTNRLGQGFFGAGRIDFRLGELMPKTRKKLYEGYGFSNFRLNFDIKYQNISFNGDGNELDFAGSSLGFGVSFDVL